MFISSPVLSAKRARVALNRFCYPSNSNLLA